MDRLPAQRNDLEIISGFNFVPSWQSPPWVHGGWRVTPPPHSGQLRPSCAGVQPIVGLAPPESVVLLDRTTNPEALSANPQAGSPARAATPPQREGRHRCAA